MTTCNWTTRLSQSALTTALGLALTTLPGFAQITPISGPTAPGLVPLSPIPAAPHPNFAFTNVLEYSDCLAAILDAYLQTDSSLPTRQNLCQANIQQVAGHDGLSQAEALELISAADFYSSHFLSRALYPPKGLRLRIADNLGFIYQIDQNDPEILSRAAI